MSVVVGEMLAPMSGPAARNPGPRLPRHTGYTFRSGEELKRCLRKERGGAKHTGISNFKMRLRVSLPTQWNLGR